MTEPKRLPFTTLNSSEKEKPTEKDPPTVRFTLSLDSTSDQLCNEFSYADLLKKSLGEKKRLENGHGDGDGDPFGDDEEQEALEAIAKKFEEKYNPKNTKWKKKHGRIQDLVDLGDGYDENDDFIDNSEAYDEVVPACLTTKLGGFYINSGKLDFKEISDDSDDDFKLGTLKKKKKKRKIESDSESDGEKKEVKIKKRKLKDGETSEKKKKKLVNGEGKAFKKPKNPDKVKKKTSPTISELMKQQSESTGGGDANGRITPDGYSQSSQDGNTSSQDEAMDSAIDSAIDSVIAMSRNDKLEAVFDSVIGMTDSNSRDNDEKKQESIPKLPEGLKPEFAEILDKLKQEAKCSSVGKGKFFSNEVNEMLLEVELTTRQLPCSQRSAIFGHLAGFLPCTKDTLLKRAKKLRLNRQDDQLKGPVDKLKDAIAAVMPDQIKRHEAEVLIWKQKQAELDANKEESNADGGKDGDTEDSEQEGEKAEHPTKKKVAAPKKKFEWNETLRTLLCEVVRVKMKIYDYMKTRTQTAEEYLRTFLDKEIKILWPKGWMQVSALFKESRPGHVSWTNPPKIKKVPMLTKTSNSTANTPVGSVKQGTTPQNSNLTITKQGVAPASAPAGSISQKPNLANNTPVRPLAAGDGNRLVPTLLDYAGEQSASSQSKSLAEKVAKEMTGNSNNSNGASSLGLSILASSAASQKYMSDRSWDHVVSDILRQTDNKKDNSYLQQFQNYASTVFQQQLSKDDGNKISPTKSQVSPSSQQSSLQLKPQDAQSMVQKLKAAQMPKQTPPQAHQKQITQNQLAAFLSQKGVGSASSPQDAFKQFLENRDKQFPPSQVSGDAKAKVVTARPVQKVKTIIVQRNSESNNSSHGNINVHKFSPPNLNSASTDVSKKPPLVRSISQGSGSMMTSNQVQGQKISPTSNISVQRVSPQQASPGIQRHSPSKSSAHYQTSLLNTSKGETTATNLLQSLFGQIDQHARQKSPSPSGISRSSAPQNKSSASPIWSMTSIVQSQTGSVPAKTSPTYAMPGLPKPVPGYQSIKPLSLGRDAAAGIGISSQSSSTMKSLLHTNIPQGIQGHTSPGFIPTSPLLPGQQGNALQHQAGFFPPYTTQQSAYNYGSYYTGKSSSSSQSHGY